MTKTWHRAAAACLVAAFALVTNTSDAHAQTDPAPTVAAERYYLHEDERVLITGRGWEPATVVKIEICGNAALDLSVDCSQASSSTAVVISDGTFHDTLAVTEPPAPCPCVVRVSAREEWVFATTPVVFPGRPSVAPRSAAPTPLSGSKIEVESAWISGASPLAEAFGAEAKRSLVLNIRNNGLNPLNRPLLTVRWSRGDDPAHVIDAPFVGRLDPGQLYRVEVPFSIGPLSSGDYRISGEIGEPGALTAFTAAASVPFPWGLLIGGVLLTTAISWLLGRRLRRRRHYGPGDFEGIAAPVAASTARPGRPKAAQLVAFGLLAVGGLALTVDRVEAQEDEPPPASQIAQVVSGDGSAPGEAIVVAGTNWEPLTPLSAAVCGNLGQKGATDCVSLGASFVTDGDGAFSLSAILVAPPTDCPCIVRVRSADALLVAFAPIRIEGMEVDPQDGDIRPAEETRLPLVVGEVTVSGGGWASWFGLPSERRLEVTLTNVSSRELRDAPISPRWGDGPDPQNVIDIAVIPFVAAGETTTVDATFTLSALAMGSYEVSGAVGEPPSSIPYGTSLSTWPWALFLLAAAAISCGAVLMARRLRAGRALRIERLESAVESQPEASIKTSHAPRDDQERVSSEARLAGPSPEEVEDSLFEEFMSRLDHFDMEGLDPAHRLAALKHLGTQAAETVAVRFDLTMGESADLVDGLVHALSAQLGLRDEDDRPADEPAAADPMEHDAPQ